MPAHPAPSLTRLPPWLTALGPELSEGLIWLDADGRVTYLNPAAGPFVQWAGGDPHGLPLAELLRSAEGEPLAAEWLLDTGAAYPTTLLDGAGRAVAVTVHAAALPAPDGRDGALVVIRPATDRAGSQVLRSHFLANITHEFRTPLAALNASVEFLLDEQDHLSPAEIGQLLTSIHLSATGLQTLIDNLLETITIEAGRFTIRPTQVDLDEVIDDAVDIMRPLLMRRQQQVTVDRPGRLPPLRADAGRLTQVMVNLLSNASKFGPMGQTIEVRWREEEGQLRIAVADRGPGIPRRHRQRLFQRFTRLGAPDGAQYGIGLGLHVVKVIVEGHGGRVGMEDRPGGGSSFWFTLPLTAGRG